MTSNGVVLNYCKGALPIDAVIERVRNNFQSVLSFSFLFFRLSMLRIEISLYIVKTLICRRAAVFTFRKMKFDKQFLF